MVRRSSKPGGFRVQNMSEISNEQSEVATPVDPQPPQLEEGEVTEPATPMDTEVTGIPKETGGPEGLQVASEPPVVSVIPPTNVVANGQDDGLKIKEMRSRAILNSKFIMIAMLQQRSRLLAEKAMDVSQIEDKLWKTQAEIFDMEIMFYEKFSWSTEDWQNALQDGELEAVMRVTSIFQSGITAQTPSKGNENENSTNLIINRAISNSDLIIGRKFY